MTGIWLVRHGASTALSGLAIGATDPPLSDEGRGQADRVAATLAARPLVRILSSDRLRALATANAVAGPHGLAVEPTSALREMDFGAWEGRFLGDLWSEEPAAAKAWEQDIRFTPPSFGESLADLVRRIESFWASLRPLPQRGEIAIVAHGGSLAVLMAVITGGAIPDAFAMRLDLGAALGLMSDGDLVRP